MGKLSGDPESRRPTRRKPWIPGLRYVLLCPEIPGNLKTGRFQGRLCSMPAPPGMTVRRGSHCSFSGTPVSLGRHSGVPCSSFRAEPASSAAFRFQAHRCPSAVIPGEAGRFGGIPFSGAPMSLGRHSGRSGQVRRHSVFRHTGVPWPSFRAERAGSAASEKASVLWSGAVPRKWENVAETRNPGAPPRRKSWIPGLRYVLLCPEIPGNLKTGRFQGRLCSMPAPPGMTVRRGSHCSFSGTPVSLGRHSGVPCSSFRAKPASSAAFRFQAHRCPSAVIPGEAGRFGGIPFSGTPAFPRPSFRAERAGSATSEKASVLWSGAVPRKWENLAETRNPGAPPRRKSWIPGLRYVLLCPEIPGNLKTGRFQGRLCSMPAPPGMTVRRGFHYLLQVIVHGLYLRDKTYRKGPVIVPKPNTGHRTPE